MKEKSRPALGSVIPPVLALVGDEERTKERLLAEVIERAGPDACVFSLIADGGERPERELSRLLADLGSRPLFGGTKVVVVRDGEGLLKRIGEGLLAAVKIDAGNHLVLMFRALDGRTRFGRALAKARALLKCERPRADLDLRGGMPAGSELIQAVLAEARVAGLTLEPSVASELAGRTGNDLMLVASELEKLRLYLDGRTAVTVADVEALVPRSAAWDQFRLFQEVATGSASAALERIRGMFQEGTTDRGARRVTDPGAIASSLVAILHNRLKLLARYRSLSAQGVQNEELQKALGIRNPGQLFYLGKEVQLPLVGSAEEAARALAEADRALKTGQPAQTVVERLLIRLTLLARSAAGPRTAGSRR